MGDLDFSLKEEERCEFLVTTKRKKIWKIELEIAKEVKRICEKYNIKYFIIWGTLLGAVRHEGFIPWDDDFDIGFLREDYMKFCKVAAEEIKNPFYFQNALTDKQFFIGYARIRHINSTAWIIENSSPEYNNGIFVDIYPFDVVIHNVFIRKIQMNMINAAIWAAANYNNPPIYCWKFLKKIVPYGFIVKLHEKLCCMFNKCFFEQNIGLMYRPEEIEEGYWFHKRDVEKTVKLRFENIEFAAPKGYENILKNVYGNYMKLPPKGKRGMWHENQIVFDPDIPYKEFYKLMFLRGD